jgi:hypothetical protein
MFLYLIKFQLHQDAKGVEIELHVLFTSTLSRCGQLHGTADVPSGKGP